MSFSWLLVRLNFNAFGKKCDETFCQATITVIAMTNEDEIKRDELYPSQYLFQWISAMWRCDARKNRFFCFSKSSLNSNREFNLHGMIIFWIPFKLSWNRHFLSNSTLFSFDLAIFCVFFAKFHIQFLATSIQVEWNSILDWMSLLSKRRKRLYEFSLFSIIFPIDWVLTSHSDLWYTSYNMELFE